VVQFTQSADPLVPQWKPLAYAVGGTFAGAIVLGIIIKLILNKKIRATYNPLRTAIADVRVASSAVNQNATTLRAQSVATATEHRNSEVDATRQKLQPQQQKLIQARDAGLRQLQEQQKSGIARIELARQKSDEELAVWTQRQEAETLGRVRAEQDKLKAKFEADLAAIDISYKDRRTQLQKRWFDGLATIQAPIGSDTAQQTTRTNWHEFEKKYVPPKQFPETITLGSLSIDMQQISAGIPRDGDVAVNLPERFSVPAMIGFPSQASVMIQTEPEGREEGLRALQLIMTKVMTQVPAGRARFTIIDPVGLGQSFAGFMHLADHDDQLVTHRIWTTPEQIDQRLTDLTEHMETVIQKYLRNEFATIDQYNAQAGELAEPYRFLVIADFPGGFEGESWRRLLSIARSGARCGVYTLILRDTRKSLPADLMIEDLESASTNLVRENGRFVWRDEVYQQFPLTLDAPPDEETLTRIVHKVGRAAKEAARVEVDFTTIAPKQSDFWTQSAASELAVPIGKMGATRLQYFRCGRGMAQHSLVAGKTGSGKSTLLHAMITNLAMWYSPDEVEFYLIDFKKGVEFKTYADYGLPHARAIAVESDREFGLSVLQRIDAELVRRGEMFRKAGTQDLGAYRKKPDAEVLPRVMLIIDEFQEFFTEDDKLAQDSQLLLDRLVRQGRAFGIHVFLGSQTIGGSGGLARSTISQMGIRIALQCNETDSQLILGDNNSAARLLTRPGEAIFNDAGGAVEHNSPFQVAWLADHRKEEYLGWINDKLKTQGTKRVVIPPLVFEGNQPADITKNQRLLGAMAARDTRRMTAPVAWVGDPVAIKDPTGVTFRRQSGSNVLIVGQVDEQALSTLAAIILSLATQLPADKGKFVVLDGTPADSFLAGQLPAALEGIPNEINFVDYRNVDDQINALSDELARRREDDQGNHPGIFVIINGLQRYRTLRKGEDEGFSFSVSDEPKKASASKQFVDLIREGPSVGIHIVAWIDTLASIERTFERGLMREFDNRILFQMSSNDSSNLIDSPVANRLGFNRGLAYSEEQGVMEKFRPYGLAPKDWLKQLTQTLQQDVAPVGG
jgi:DNA segregation ATPase FtsK/SpoIIIE, S-DNA-T family